MLQIFLVISVTLISLVFSGVTLANDALLELTETPIDLTTSYTGYICLLLFVIAYVMVILEEKIHMRKSKPVMLAAGIIWILIALAYKTENMPHIVKDAISDNFLEYSELFFFLLVAMTYINSMLERGVFDALRTWLVAKGYSFRKLFWLTGFLAFFISPIADNLTTALILCAVILAVGRDQPKFITLACINVVVAANAGGAYSPFGDITTLMVWQKGVLEFTTFFALFIPALVNFTLPAALMSFALPEGHPHPHAHHRKTSSVEIKSGGLVIVALFILTIITAVSYHNFLHIPPVFGMMTGLAYLKLFGFYLRRQDEASGDNMASPPGGDSHNYGFDIFDKIAKVEWDTLFFFYGVILCVGGLSFLGYLGIVSEFIYGELGATSANIIVGILSSVIDNIPVMFAVLSMNPDMDQSQWLLVTLTAGVGGSLLSIGSAAGVALMGQARGEYTFFNHLKWTPAIAVGYAASIYVHFLLNG